MDGTTEGPALGEATALLNGTAVVPTVGRDIGLLEEGNDEPTEVGLTGGLLGA